MLLVLDLKKRKQGVLAACPIILIRCYSCPFQLGLLLNAFTKLRCRLIGYGSETDCSILLRSAMLRDDHLSDQMDNLP